MLWETDFISYEESIPALLAQTSLTQLLRETSKPIVIKPNLIERQAHPITTHVESVRALISFLRMHTDNDISIAEAAGGDSTMDCFSFLGYTALAKEMGVRLVDLNADATVTLRDERAETLQTFECPVTVRDAFLVSLPVLKRHTLAGVTLAMKNLIGLFPEPHYGVPGHYSKAKTHAKLHETIFDVNRYVKTDFVLLDASIGMARAHLSGPPCSPPVQKLLAADNVLDADKAGCRLLGLDWKTIKHIALLDVASKG